MKTNYSKKIALATAFLILILGNAYAHSGSGNGIGQITFTGSGGYDDFGMITSKAGDVNNDGYDDILVGEYGYNSNSGRSYLYLGGPNMDNIADLIFEGENTGDFFGAYISHAGDVNNDNYDDIIISATGYDSNTGRVYIHFGGPAMDNTADVIITGTFTDGYLGNGVSAAGDVNNDGYDDVIMGNRGTVYILYGGALMDNMIDKIIPSPANHYSFGDAVSSAGDVNNDGFDDVIIGEPNITAGRGNVYLYLGGASMDTIADQTFVGETIYNYFGFALSQAGDLNNDNYDDILIGAQGFNTSTGRAYVYYGGAAMDNTADAVFTGDSLGVKFGYSLSGGGDFNNDGYDDLVISAYKYGNSKGRAFLYYGGNTLDTIADEIFTGEYQSDFYGVSIGFAGDVNNDGNDDILSGAGKYQQGPGNGKAYLIGKGFSTKLSVKAFIEGFYNPATDNMISDTIRIYMRSASSPYTLQDSAIGVLSASGDLNLDFENSVSGTNYLIFEHRNSIETWSKNGGEIMNLSDSVSYDLSSSSSQAYGSNLKMVDPTPLRYAIYSGDENKNGIIDLSDVVAVSNNANSFVNGYVSSDMNGDGVTDLSDIVITSNNASAFVAAIIP